MDQPDAVYDVELAQERMGWKELNFSISRWVEEDGERTENPLIRLIQNEYKVRVSKGGKVDWYIVYEPEWTRNEDNRDVHITCGHVSSILQKRGLYLYLDDSNGIGTLPYLAEQVLKDTGWTVGVCDAFYEADGITTKVRSLQTDGKEGAYANLQSLCS